MFEAAEATFEILARHIIEGIPKPFKLEERQCIDRKIILPDGGEAEVSDAIVKLWVNGNFRHFPGTGDGPVNALDLALRRALLKAYSCLESVRLEDYKVRVLNGGGTASKVRVLIEASDGTLVWSTVGVSTNVIEASWLGLVDMYWYKLLLDGVEIAENHELPKE
jgi:2-isopropylmalate synthase